MNGFRKMISDNIPTIWDLALRWCHCRQLWIDTAYENYVGKYNTDWRPLKERNRLKAIAVEQITLKRKVYGKHMRFEDTVNLGNLQLENRELYKYWRSINTWVKWFTENYRYIVNTAEIQMQCVGKPVEEIAEYLNEKYNMNNIELAKYILKSISC